MVDLRGDAVINDDPAKISDVHRHSVPLNAPHVCRPTCRVFCIKGGCREAIRVDKLIASFLFTAAACHYDDRHPKQEPDLPLEFREEDAVAKKKRHATIHVAITRVAARPAKLFANPGGESICFRPPFSGEVPVRLKQPIVRAPRALLK